MSSSKNNSTGLTAQGPGSEHNSSHSSDSVSLQFEREALEIIRGLEVTNVTFKDVPSICVPKEKWADLANKLTSLLQRSTDGSVPKTQLVALNDELQKLRLKANQFENASDRFEVAKSVLTKDLESAKAALSREQTANAKAQADFASTLSSLKTQLANAQEASKMAKAEIKSAKGRGDAALAEEIAVGQAKLSAEISRLNDSLQAAKTAASNENKRVKKLESQVLELSNELNLEKSKVRIALHGKGDSFAEVASSAGTANVKLAKSLWGLLSAKSQGLLEKARSSNSDDVKNKAFWLKASLSSTRSVVLRPYQRLFGGLHDDIAKMSHASRLLFNPVLDAMLDGLSPGGQLLSAEELTRMMSEIQLDDVVIAPRYQAPGLRTLADLDKNGKTLDDVGMDSNQIEMIDNTLRLRKGKDKAVVDPAPSDSGSYDPDNEDPLGPSDEPLSIWIRARRWFHNSFESMSNRVRESLRRRPKRLARLFGLKTGNIFKRFCAVPYEWYIWCFP